MAIRIYDAVAVAAATAVAATPDDGPAAGTIEIRTGAQPAINGALTGTVLATFTLNDPAFGTPTADGTDATAAGNGLPKTVSGAADDTAGYGAVLDSTGVVKWTGTCGQGSGDFNLSNLSIATGQDVTLNSLNYNFLQQ